MHFNSLWLSDAYMHQWTYHHWFSQWLGAWSAPSHYLNQCWNAVNWTLKNKLKWNFNPNSNIFIQENAFESAVCEMAAILSRPQCVNIKGKSCQFEEFDQIMVLMDISDFMCICCNRNIYQYIAYVYIYVYIMGWFSPIFHAEYIPPLNMTNINIRNKYIWFVITIR